MELNQNRLFPSFLTFVAAYLVTCWLLLTPHLLPVFAAVALLPLIGSALRNWEKHSRLLMVGMAFFVMLFALSLLSPDDDSIYAAVPVTASLPAMGVFIAQRRSRR